MDPPREPNDRTYWLSVLDRLARPVLQAAAEGRLHETMPVEVAPDGDAAERRKFAHLEAVGRLLSGVAPFLELPGDDEGRGELRDLARRAVAGAVDPSSPDFCNFTEGRQPLVDAAFLAQAVLRAPTALYDPLPERTKRHLADALVSTRKIAPGRNNWLLFAAMVEAGLCRMGRDDWDAVRVDYALWQHEQWYAGDGAYGDGPRFHADYYNAFVIVPMMIDVLGAVPGPRHAGRGRGWEPLRPKVAARATRLAEIQERLISPEGTIPPVGRSLAYRFGALQCLAQAALHGRLPATVSPGQARSALTAALHRFADAPGTFDDAGWLRIGFAGHQPSVAEGYINTGSLYLFACGLLPLGLPPADPFWSDPAADWTARKIYAGADVRADHAIAD